MSDLMEAITRVKRATRHPDTLAICEALEQRLLAERVTKPVTKSVTSVTNGVTSVTNGPKRNRAAYMRDYRRSKSKETK